MPYVVTCDIGGPPGYSANDAVGGPMDDKTMRDISDTAINTGRIANALEEIATVLEEVLGKGESGRMYIRTFNVRRQNMGGAYESNHKDG